jgi:F0F1-type ATP synthase membrane subunit c/vacuolar-type H+-ATPase subunit K
MKRITTSALAVLLAVGLTLAGSGSAQGQSAGFGGKSTKTQGGIGCCVDKV